MVLDLQQVAEACEKREWASSDKESTQVALHSVCQVLVKFLEKNDRGSAVVDPNRTKEKCNKELEEAAVKEELYLSKNRRLRRSLAQGSDYESASRIVEHVEHKEEDNQASRISWQKQRTPRLCLKKLKL